MTTPAPAAGEREASKAWWPMCAVCGRPVEAMEAWEDVPAYGRRFRARCHGATESVFLGHAVLLEGEIRRGVAFSAPLLEGLTP